MITLIKKDELRKIALSKRADFNKNKSVLIVHKILNSEEFKNAKNIALYYPINHEIDITGILNTEDKNFYLPRCKDNEIEFVKFCGFNFLTKGKFNILEPLGDKIEPNILDIIYIPALMANKKFYRVGYGIGYYDRFFHANSLTATQLRIVATELISADYVEDKFDFNCDGIISA